MLISRRRLPHLCAIGRPVFVTFRLRGSLPTNRHFPHGTLASGKAFITLDRLLDEARIGPTHLRIPAIAQIVAEAIHHHAKHDYDLHAWTIMPNHVHLLFTPHVNACDPLRRLKGVTARNANQHLGRTGQSFWQNESYDHLVRNSAQLWHIANYIVQNPVRALLTAAAEDHPWSGTTMMAVGLKPSAD